ncbi:MAG: WGR domain-containing protein [Phycisphaerae bacterium]|nr:WGR domain-containing protein [Phycisphaerae bacterium]MCZ2400070.1 WGR domain-containing protein [Phycisphaerae bacterium]
MLDLLTIALEAHSDERNHHRRYELAVGRDLLGHWVVTVRYGRVGQPLRTIQSGSPDSEAARSIFGERLRRRLSAPRRIGCAYRMVGFEAEGGIDAKAWCPGGVLTDLLG